MKKVDQNFLKLQVADDLKSKTIDEFVKRSIKKGSYIQTDDYNGYNNLLRIGYEHEHQKYEKNDEYLDMIHTIISNLKSYILGTYHGFRKENFQVFLDEFCYRFNRRFFIGSLFDRLLKLCLTPNRLKLKDLRIFA